MPDFDQMSDEQFLAHALDLLSRELGLGGFARFLMLYRSGTGDYTRDRHQWLDDLTVEQIVEQIKEDAKIKAA